MFPGEDQDTFVANTERDAKLFNTSLGTAWEIAGNWEHALQEYFPRFAKNSIVRGLVSVNVPYMVPVLAFGEKFFKTVHDKSVSSNEAVVFRPNEWRGINGGSQNLNVTDMAKSINNYPKGTVSAIYITSDGGVRASILPFVTKIRIVLLRVGSDKLSPFCDCSFRSGQLGHPVSVGGYSRRPRGCCRHRGTFDEVLHGAAAQNRSLELVRRSPAPRDIHCQSLLRCANPGC